MSLVQANLSLSRWPHPAVLWRAVCLGIVIGAALVSWVSLYQSWLFLLLAATCWLAWRKPPVRLAALGVVGVILVLWRGSGLPPKPEPDFVGRQTFVATVVGLPQPGERLTRYVVEQANGVRVLLTLRPMPSFGPGDSLRINCRALTPIEFVPWLNRGIGRECSFPEVELVSQTGHGLKRWLWDVRQTAAQRLRAVVPEPYASLGAGILWGDDAGLPRELAEAFRRTGTSHITAASGYNVMVLSEIVLAVLIGLGLWRRSASLGVLVVVIGFVLMSGADPAVVRAGLMGALLVGARLTGRRADGLNLLLGAAAVMLLAAPRLISDLGFQLSFASMAGLLFLGPTLAAKLTWLPRSAGLRESAAQTLAAVAATVPVVWLRLGTFSVVAPLANLAIAPAVALVYVLALALLPLMFVPAVAGPFAAGFTLILGYIIWAITNVAELPWASLSAWVAGGAALAAYVGLGWWLWPRPSKPV